MMTRASSIVHLLSVVICRIIAKANVAMLERSNCDDCEVLFAKARLGALDMKMRSLIENRKYASPYVGLIGGE